MENLIGALREFDALRDTEENQVKDVVITRAVLFCLSWNRSESPLS